MLHGIAEIRPHSRIGLVCNRVQRPLRSRSAGHRDLFRLYLLAPHLSYPVVIKRPTRLATAGKRTIIYRPIRMAIE